MEKLKRAVIKEEFAAITDTMLEAIILNQMIYWSERISDFDQFIAEETERFEKYINVSESKGIQIPTPLKGWIYKKASQLNEEVMASTSNKTIERTLSSLVKKEFLDRRNNPEHKWDRMYQYRVNFPNIIKAMAEKGYVLQGYKVDLSFMNNGDNDEELSNDSKRHEDGSKEQIVALKRQIDELKKQIVALNEQDVPAITEITTETTTKTTTEIINEEYMDLTFIDDAVDKVKITKDQYEKLINKFTPELVDKNIISLDNYIVNGKGNKYKDHYRTLNTWCLNDHAKNDHTKKDTPGNGNYNKNVQAGLDLIKKYESEEGKEGGKSIWER